MLEYWKGNSMTPRKATLRKIALTPLVLALAISATAALAEDHTVTANADLTFTPAVLNIQVGDTVTWVNGGGLHNVNAPGFFRCANGCDGEGGDGDPAVNPWEFTLTFDDPGTIDYFCDVHLAQNMEGTVNVLGGGSPDLSITGDCPGDIVLNLTGGTPGGSIALVSSASEGSSNVPQGSCAGTPLGLSAPGLLAIVPLDGNGAFSTTRNVPAPLCGLFLQVLDLGTCQTSNVAQIP